MTEVPHRRKALPLTQSIHWVPGDAKSPASDTYLVFMHQRADLVSCLVRLSTRNHLARDLQSGEIRSVRRNRVEAHALQHIRPIDPGRRHFDQDLARLGLRRGQFFPGEGVDADGVLAEPGMHGVLQ